MKKNIKNTVYLHFRLHHTVTLLFFYLNSETQRLSIKCLRLCEYNNRDSTCTFVITTTTTTFCIECKQNSNKINTKVILKKTQ